MEEIKERLSELLNHIARMSWDIKKQDGVYPLADVYAWIEEAHVTLIVVTRI